MISTSGRIGLKAALFARRVKMGRAARGKPRKRTRWLYPWATEKHYAKAIRAWIKPMQDYVNAYIKNNSEAILRGDSAALMRQDEIPGGSYRRMVRSLNGWYSTYLPPIKESGTRDAPPIVFMGLGNIANSLANFNSEQWNKAAKAELGVEFPVYESWWPGMKEAWQEENYMLIQDVSRDYIKQVNRAAEKAIINGLSPGQLAKAIHKINKKIEASRVNLIARDQIGKLNGQITQARMQAVGLEMYEWSTVADERVRDSHADLEGVICRWDDPTVYSDDGGKTWKPRPADWAQEHPGQDIQCRCTALSYWDELIDEVDREIDEMEGYVAGASDAEPSGSDTSETEDPPERGLRSPLIETQLGITQEDANGWISSKRNANIHNDYKTPGYKNNCQRSVVAYELQRRGYTVTAMPAPLNRKNDPIKNGYECFVSRRMERAPEGRDQLVSRLMRFGDGARFAVFQKFSDDSGEYGHIYIAERMNNGIKFIDPQINSSGPTVESYLDRIRVNEKDGKMDLHFFRIDDAILNPKVDFTKVVTAYDAKRKVDRMDSADILYMDNTMTKEKAYETLKNSHLVASWTNAHTNETWSFQIGDIYSETPECYSFVVYPHSTKVPLDLDYAIQFFVMKDSGIVVRSDSPMTPEQLKEVNKAQ